MNADDRVSASPLDTLRFDDAGLVAVVLQDANSGEVLTLAYANREALELTLHTAETHLWSRSRKELWRKGATSGNVQRVVEVRSDCDGDAVIYRVIPAGPACHTGAVSCFFTPLLEARPSMDNLSTADPKSGSTGEKQAESDGSESMGESAPTEVLAGSEMAAVAASAATGPLMGNTVIGSTQTATSTADAADAFVDRRSGGDRRSVGGMIRSGVTPDGIIAVGDVQHEARFEIAMRHLRETIAKRRGASPDESYIAKLLSRGVDLVGKKVGEEAVEVVIAAKNGSREEIVWEVADLLFHTLVLLEATDVSLDEIGGELLRRAH